MVAGVLILATCLTGCGQQSKQKEMRDYITSVKARTKGDVESLPVLMPSEKFKYASTHIRSPFQSKINDTVADMPTPNRPKEALEEYPLDALRMVGTLTNGKQMWALIAAPNGAIYRVSVGNHIGKNFGEVTKISKREVSVVEMMRDSQGWRKRNTEMVLTNNDDKNQG